MEYLPVFSIISDRRRVFLLFPNRIHKFVKEWTVYKDNLLFDNVYWSTVIKYTFLLRVIFILFRFDVC